MASSEFKGTMTSLQKMRLVSALTGACRNEALLKAFSSMEEGDVLLEIFAEAVNNKMEEMFSKPSPNDGVEITPLAEQVDELYAKISAISQSSAVQAIEILAKNVSGGSLPAVGKPRPASKTVSGDPLNAEQAAAQAHYDRVRQQQAASRPNEGGMASQAENSGLGIF